MYMLHNCFITVNAHVKGQLYRCYVRVKHAQSVVIVGVSVRARFSDRPDRPPPPVAAVLPLASVPSASMAAAAADCCRASSWASRLACDAAQQTEWHERCEFLEVLPYDTGSQPQGSDLANLLRLLLVFALFLYAAHRARELLELDAKIAGR